MRLLLIGVVLCTPCWAARFVTTSPQTTEIAFQLGLGSEVVGVSAGSTYPAEARNLPSIGELFAPSLEKTFALRPDCVILDTHNLNEPYARALRSLGIPTFVWNTHSPETLLADGKIFVDQYASGRGRSVLERWEKCLELLKPPPNKTSYIGFVWLDPPVLMGQTSFLSHLLEKLGYQNALSSRFRSPYLSVAEEWLVLTHVQKIFYLVMPGESESLSHKKFQHWWPVGNAQVVRLNADDFARASLTPFAHLSLLTSRPLPEACGAL